MLSLTPMNPALSVVFFTTASGAGYGLLFWLGLLRPLGLRAGRSLASAASALALALGADHRRACCPRRCISATRSGPGAPSRNGASSWLSREGVAAVATYVPAGAVRLGWVLLGRTDGLARLSPGCSRRARRRGDGLLHRR